MVIYLKDQQNSKSLLESLFRALRSEQQTTTKWQNIVMCTSDKWLNNKLLQLMQMYFPKQPNSTTDDDSSDDEQILVKVSHEDAEGDNNTSEEDTKDRESREDDTDIEEISTDPDSNKTDNSDAQLGRGHRKQIVFYDNSIPH